jgi:hypothetical protein
MPNEQTLTRLGELGNYETGSDTMELSGQACRTDSSACAPSQHSTPEPHREVYLSQTLAASGLSRLGISVMASFGHAALHTPHPKHLVGSI